MQPEPDLAIGLRPPRWARESRPPYGGRARPDLPRVKSGKWRRNRPSAAQGRIIEDESQLFQHPTGNFACEIVRFRTPGLPAMRLTPLAASLPATVPFVGPETQERASGRTFVARLGANESVFGPSPQAVAAMAEAAALVWRYGDPENHDLKAAIAAHHGVSPGNIAVGEGIDALPGQSGAPAGRAGHPGRHLGGRLSDLQLPRRGLRRPAAPGALPRRCRGPRGASRQGPRDRRAAGLSRQSRQPDGQLARRGADRGTDRGAAGGLPALPRRGLCRFRAGGRHPAARSLRVRG